MTTMAAVDLGAQSGRVAIGRFDGEGLALEETRRFANVPIEVGDRLRWDIAGLYAEVVAGLSAATEAADDVRSVAVDSWGVDFGLLDGDGRLLANPVHYRDGHRARAYDRALERVPARELYERTGIQLLPINSVFELASMADDGDPALATAETMLLIPDLLHHWLCGSQVTERTNASTTQLLDPRLGTWTIDILERLDVRTEMLPEVVDPGTDLGPLAPEVAAETGLGSARVLAVGTHDTASAVVAVPFRRRGSVYISAGTWSLVGLELDQPLIDDRTFAANLTNEVGVAGTYRLLRNVTGLWLLHQCRQEWARVGRDRTFDELEQLAAAAEPLRTLIDPNDALFDEPGDMPSRIRAFCVDSEQPEPEDDAAVVRCILESLALKHWETIELLADVSGARPTEVHIVGGGARNELLCQWTADAARLPVLAGPEEATLIGNLLVQAVTLGELASIADAREVVSRSFPPTVYEPCEHAAWEDARVRFALLGVGAAARFGG